MDVHALRTVWYILTADFWLDDLLRLRVEKVLSVLWLDEEISVWDRFYLQISISNEIKSFLELCQTLHLNLSIKIRWQKIGFTGPFLKYKYFKCPYGQNLFLGFGISITSNNVFKPTKVIAIKSSFKFPALATPNEVDGVMKDWWQMTPLQEHLKASCFYFACLTTALLRQLRFAYFFVE